MSIQVSPELTKPESQGESSVSVPQAYLTELLKQSASLPDSLAGLQEVRDRAFNLASELAIPTKQNEEWRFTDLSALFQLKFILATPQTLTDITQFVATEALNSHLVFVNGVYSPELSDISALPPGIIVGNLADNPIPNLSDYLGQQPGFDEVFTALNTASFNEGAVIFIPKNQQVDSPIHLLFISTGGNEPQITHPRCLVVAESGSRVTFIEHYAATAVASLLTCWDALTQKPYFTNAVTEIWLGSNAEVHHSRLQREAGNAFHIGKTAVSQQRDSRYTCTAISLGAKLSRHNLEVFQQGEGTQTTLNGLTVIDGEQLADTHSAIAYNYPNGTSRQLHKCIIDGRAHAVFNGKVFVPKPAQLTDAGQLNRNLLLSPKARVDTKPQLEITADNVKCSHGATVGQLDEEEVFYLQSRGLDKHSSRNLLVDAFAAEIINGLPVASLNKLLKHCVSCRTNE